MRQLVSLQVGLPQERMSSLDDGKEAVWISAIYKSSVSGRIRLGETGLDGDGQADMKNHGGPDKAVCCYPAEHYAAWRATLGLTEFQFSFGAFGENFTLEGMPEDTVCVGDIYALGMVRIQISEPRVPCFKVGRRWSLAQLPGQMVESGRTGYYLRILQTGEVGAGDTLSLLDRPLPDWTITRLNDAMYVHKKDKELVSLVASIDLLSEAWRFYFQRRAGVTINPNE